MVWQDSASVQKKAMILFFLITQMLPSTLVLTSLYIMFSKIGLLNTYWAPILADATLGILFSIIILRTYFLSIPKELDEAAIMDGCSRLQVFSRIIVPISKPTFVTIGILSSVFWWNELTQPVFYINSDKWRTLTIALMTSYMYTSGNAFVINWPSIMAASSLMIIPPMIRALGRLRFASLSSALMEVAIIQPS